MDKNPTVSKILVIFHVVPKSQMMALNLLFFTESQNGRAWKGPLWVI